MVRRSASGASPWSGVSYAIVVLFVTLFFVLGVSYRRPHFDLGSGGKKKYDFPDFEQLKSPRSLSEQNINLDTNERIIIIGDVHGMNHSLADLLSELSYNQTDDILVFAGDLLAKSTHAGSLSVLDFFLDNRFGPSPVSSNRTERIFSVRGNHDQLVVQWRSWREWFERLTIPAPSSSHDSNDIVTRGKDFIRVIESEWEQERRKREADAEEWVDVARKRAEGTWREEWWKRIPSSGQGKKGQEWKIFGDHYWLARDMTADQTTFLNSLPLVIHVPHLHFFVVHAGLLPYDPRLPIDDPHQPLAHPPQLVHLPPALPNDDGTDEFDADEEKIDFYPDNDQQDILNRRDTNSDNMRKQQEKSILTKIKQNKDPWVVLNMRGVKKNGKVTRNTEKGTPWSKLWNGQMKSCGGIDSNSLAQVRDDEEEEEDRNGKRFPCEPTTVVYGHAASRGLDIKRYSLGLDTGCVYGQQLTALVVSQGRSKHHKGRKVKFGDGAMGLDARLVQVECFIPPESEQHTHE